MNTKHRLAALRNIKSRPVLKTVVTASDLVRLSRGEHDDGTIPLIVSPTDTGVNVIEWARTSNTFLQAQLLIHGAILFRGFNLAGPDGFQELSVTLSGDLLPYRERAASRKQVREGVYTSTEFPPDQEIPLHHEMSYASHWPRTIWFYCDEPSATGGCTPITDDREVIKHIPDRIKSEFLAKGVMYVRNFGHGIDMSWQEAFQTTERQAVEQYCEAQGIGFEWLAADRLRTTQRRQVVAVHPETGDVVWFNHAHMFHWSNIDPETRRALFAQLTEDELPRNAVFGDGTSIPPADLETIRQIYDQMAVRIPWQRGDVLLLDNMLASHGRERFTGPRRVLVAMAGDYSMEASHPGDASRSALS